MEQVKKQSNFQLFQAISEEMEEPGKQALKKLREGEHTKKMLDNSNRQIKENKY